MNDNQVNLIVDAIQRVGSTLTWIALWAYLIALNSYFHS